eukprot:COSAG01_NODE_42648_length_438_cov_0.460177_1_plen_44_part_10
MANAPQKTTKRQGLTQVLDNHYPTIRFASTQIIGMEVEWRPVAP